MDCSFLSKCITNVSSSVSLSLYTSLSLPPSLTHTHTHTFGLCLHTLRFWDFRKPEIKKIREGADEKFAYITEDLTKAGMKYSCKTKIFPIQFIIYYLKTKDYMISFKI